MRGLLFAVFLAGCAGGGLPAGSQIEAPTSTNDLWVVTDRDAWAVGPAGMIKHWNGAAWAQVPSGTTADLYSVSGDSPIDATITGDRIVLHWDGVAWTIQH